MQTNEHETPLDTADFREITEKVENGEYFREAKATYANVYLDPMSQRYLLLFLIGGTLLTLLIAYITMNSLYPLKRDYMYPNWTEDILEEKPVIRPLKAFDKEDVNVALKRFFVSEYVKRRESFDINTLEANVRFVKAQSADSIYSVWQKELDPSNPESPISQFQRHSTRNIAVVSATPNADGTMDVLFDAVVEGPEEQKRTRMIATIAFQYSDVTIDPSTNKPTQVRFQATDYRTRRLQE